MLQTIEATGCESVGATHGYTGVLTRYLREQGLDADEIATRYVGELDSEVSKDINAEADDAP